MAKGCFYFYFILFFKCWYTQSRQHGLRGAAILHSVTLFLSFEERSPQIPADGKNRTAVSKGKSSLRLAVSDSLEYSANLLSQTSTAHSVVPNDIRAERETDSQVLPRGRQIRV